MSIWPDWKIREWIQNDDGVIPVNLVRINPASIDLGWSGRYRVAEPSGWGDLHQARELEIAPRGFLLLDTAEYVSMPPAAVGFLMLKSSLGRQGLEHLHAGYFDPGFHGTATLEVFNAAPWVVKIRIDQPIVQLAIMDMKGRPDRSYRETGRYNGQKVPQVSK